jgi:uncharacterized repeat protein (TIGR03803 family)
VIYNQQSDASNPVSSLVAGKDGTFYSTAGYGGIGYGSVFQIIAPAAGQTTWTENVLYSFQNGSDGFFPEAALTSDGKGGFYGSTVLGGDGPCDYYGYAGCGIVYHLRPPANGKTKWTETIIYSFQGGSDGDQPSAGMLLDPTTGVLYGTTFIGGNSNAGTVFALTPPAAGQSSWTETILYSFTGADDGGFPAASLIMDETGALISTTSAGGFAGQGTVFRLAPPPAGETQWTETVLYSFLGLDDGDGGNPQAGLITDTSGNLYGTTLAGGFHCDQGTVFMLTPPGSGQTAWTETVLYQFCGPTDASAPYSNLLMDARGAIFGTTWSGGKSDLGTTFRLEPPAAGATAWTEKVLNSFGDTPEGHNPVAGLVAAKVGDETVLLSVTENGGTAGDGTVFELSESGFIR